MKLIVIALLFTSCAMGEQYWAPDFHDDAEIMFQNLENTIGKVIDLVGNESLPKLKQTLRKYCLEYAYLQPYAAETKRAQIDEFSTRCWRDASNLNEQNLTAVLQTILDIHNALNIKITKP